MPFHSSRRVLALTPMLLVVIGAVGIAVYVGANSSTSVSGATIVVEPSEVIVEAKKASGAEKLTAEFQLVNRGKRAVRLGEINSPCPCAVGSPPSTNVVKPGERVTVTVVATPPAYGSRDASVTISTDDPATPLLQLRLALKGNEPEAPYVTYTSGSIQLAGSRPGQVVTQTLEVRTVETIGTKPWLLADQQLTPELTIVLREPPTDSSLSDTTVFRTYNYKVEATTPASEDAPLTMPFFPKGTIPAKRKVPAVSVLVSLVPSFRVHPREVFISNSETHVLPIERTIAIASTGKNEPFQVSVQNVSANWLETDVPKFEDNEGVVAVRVTIRLKSIPPSGGGGELQRGMVYFKAQEPGGEATPIELPVTVQIRR